MKYLLTYLITLILSPFTLSDYHPSYCTVENYLFTFIKDNETYKVHGLWPEACKECRTCNYPTCCNNNVTFTEPHDPTNFIKNNWYQSLAHNNCNVCSVSKYIPLFEHEFYTHGTCMNIRNTTTYLNVVKSLYEKFNDLIVNNSCGNYHYMMLHLNNNMNFVKTICM
jgi:ribonuclease I